MASINLGLPLHHVNILPRTTCELKYKDSDYYHKKKVTAFRLHGLIRRLGKKTCRRTSNV